MKPLYYFLFFLLALSRASFALTVTFAGDYGANNHTKAVLSRIESSAPDFHIALGDLSYGDISEEKWCGMVNQSVTRPFLLVPGNHETPGDQADADIEAFARCLPYSYAAPMQGTYPSEYYFDAPAASPLARFIVISPDLGLASGRVEFKDKNIHMAWLEKAIDDARAAGIPWVVVAMHKVCLSTETKSCEIGEELANMLTQRKVDVVLSGHVHAYERTHALGCVKANRFDAACVNRGQQGYYRKGSGTVFITVGNGGIPLRELNEKDAEKGYFASRFGKKQPHYGIGQIILGHDTLTHAFIDAQSGKMLDYFTLGK